MQKKSVPTVISLLILAVAAISVLFTPTSTNGITIEKSGTVESVTVVNDAWVVRAGGNNASTHFARLKYKIPENKGQVFTDFYLKTVIVLPPDFYTRQTASFRLLNTTNTAYTLNGVKVGAVNSNESRVGVYIRSDQFLQLRVEHETVSEVQLYRATTKLPVGEHTIELWGNVAKIAPWGLRIDGVVVASGNAMLSNSTTLPIERIVSRGVTGIDGAADSDAKYFELTVKSFEVGQFPPISSVTPTYTQIPATFTFTATMTNTPTPSTTVTITPTMTSIPVCYSIFGEGKYIGEFCP